MSHRCKGTLKFSDFINTKRGHKVPLSISNQRINFSLFFPGHTKLYRCLFPIQMSTRDSFSFSFASFHSLVFALTEKPLADFLAVTIECEIRNFLNLSIAIVQLQKEFHCNILRGPKFQQLTFLYKNPINNCLSKNLMSFRVSWTCWLHSRVSFPKILISSFFFKEYRQKCTTFQIFLQTSFQQTDKAQNPEKINIPTPQVAKNYLIDSASNSIVKLRKNEFSSVRITN